MRELLQLVALFVTSEADNLLVTAPVVIASIALGVWTLKQFPPIRKTR